MIDKKYIDLILDTVDLAEVVSDYGIKLHVSGHTAKGLCPFHNEDTASFCVNTAKNLWHCFGCGKGGNVINFVMEMDNLSFLEAIKKLLKEKKNIDLKVNELRLTPEEEAKYKKREAMHIINDKLCAFYVSQLDNGTADANAAKAYMLSRWNADFCKEQQIGYAPNDWTSVVKFAEKVGLSLDLMQQMGILRLSEKTHSLYCVYKNRLMIPIRDRYSNIEGFTARALDDKSECKYLNSADSELYHKSESVFGIDAAVQKARKECKLYLVEGAPDVMKLQSLDILNTIASLGGSWNDKQFQKLKDLRLQNCTLCFIPDSDVPKNNERLGAGFANVLRNGALAMRLGFTVSVKEIPNDLTVEQPKKIDPDEFFTDKSYLAKLEEREFLLWSFEKKFTPNGTTEEKQKAIEETCELLLCIKDEVIQERYITALARIDGNKTIWRQALNTAMKKRQKQLSEKNNEGDIDMLRSFGFTVQHGCYFGYNQKGEEKQWSNFTLKPLFHVKDDIHPVRLFEICNSDGQKEIIELNMEEFTSSKKLRQKLVGIGNFIWLADDSSQIQLMCYLAKVSETAVEIKQLGWQQQGFYCFCNGALEDGVWHPVDDKGIVRLKKRNYYLPAMSQIYKDSTELYSNERKFRHQPYSNISLHDYFSKIIDVFGDNAVIGLCFYIATLFKDVYKQKTTSFPILNIFGPKGSGKTELAETMMAFFVVGNDPQNIETATVPALADAVASVSNALVHIDEYKNGIDTKKIEWLKDLWACIGRSRMNMDKDKKREQARVDSGIILTGQEMPTADIALFTRLIFLAYDRDHHNQQERERFAELMQLRMYGATHITIQLLSLRDKFTERFELAWEKAKSDVALHPKWTPNLKDRIESNWLVPLSAYLALQGEIDCPFTYDRLLDLCMDGLIRQNKLCNRSDEVSNFWSLISCAQQKGELINEKDYLIKSKNRLKTNKMKDGYEFGEPRQILMLRKNTALNAYQKIGREMNISTLPNESIEYYLQISPEFLGVATSAERFKRINSNGQPVQNYVLEGGKPKCKIITEQDRPLCFCYTEVCERYGINLSTFLSDSLDDAPTEVQQEDLPF